MSVGWFGFCVQGEDNDETIALLQGGNRIVHGSVALADPQSWEDEELNKNRELRLWNHRDNTRSSDWQDTVVIQYKFDAGIDSTRMKTFRHASKLWEKDTCVRFQETDDNTLMKENGWIHVTKKDAKSCAALQGLGFGRDPAETQHSYVNMGWCKRRSHVGALAHELGHVLGMFHEMQRPDATQPYKSEFDNKTYGPYLKIYWDNMKLDSTKDQFAENNDAYVGSPDVGHAEYDFDSIMHYGSRLPNRKRSMAAVGDHKGEKFGVGKRPSAGDLAQIRDMYNCVPKAKTCQDWALRATTGACVLDFESCCVSTPVSYSSGDSCNIYLGDSPGAIQITEDHFNLLSGDKVTLKGKEYVAKLGPLGVEAPRGVIEWMAGSASGQGAGFQMCLPKSCDPNGLCDRYYGVATCDFAYDGFCDGTFSNDKTADLKWVRHRGRTASGMYGEIGKKGSTGPLPASVKTADCDADNCFGTADSDGYYIYVEANGAVQGQKARLLSTEFNLQIADPRILTFHVNMNSREANKMGTLSVKLVHSGGEVTLWHKDPTKSGPGMKRVEIGVSCEYDPALTGSEVAGLPDKCKVLGYDPAQSRWRQYSVKPSITGITGAVTIVFEVKAGRTDFSDIAIDAVRFVDPSDTPTDLPAEVAIPTTTTTTACFTIDMKRTPAMYGQGKTKEVSSIECQKRCQNAPGCKSFSYYTSKSCYLHDDQAILKADSGTITGPQSCADSSNPLGIVKKCFLSREDDDQCLTNKTRWPYAKDGETCHDKQSSCQSQWHHRQWWGKDYQKRMHECCPATCDVCGCGLSGEACSDCEDNSDMCLKAQSGKFKGHDCASAAKFCDDPKYAKDVLKCCPGVCKNTFDLSMDCNKNNDKCLQKQRHWGVGFKCDDPQSRKHCKKGTTPWYAKMSGFSWRYDMMTCCPKVCQEEGEDTSKAICHHVAAPETCQLSY